MPLIFTLTNVSSEFFITFWMGRLPQTQLAAEFTLSIFQERPSWFLYWSATITTPTFSSHTVWNIRSCAASQWLRLICISMPFLKQVLVGLLVYWTPSGSRHVGCLFIPCFFAEIATWFRPTLLRFVAFFAVFNAAFRCIYLRGTFAELSTIASCFA